MVYVSIQVQAQISTKDQAKIDELLRKAETGDEAEYYEAGYIYQRNGLSSKALELYKLGIERCKGKENLRILSNAIGNIYFEQANYSEAIHYYKQSLEFAMKTSRPEKTAIGTSNLIGDTYLKLAKPKDALEYYNFSLNYSLQSNNKKETDKSLTNIGKCYAMLGNSSESKKYNNLVGSSGEKIFAKLNEGIPKDERSSQLHKIKIQYKNLMEENSKVHAAYDSTLKDNSALKEERKILEDSLKIRQEKLKEIETTLSNKIQELNTLEQILRNRELALLGAIGTTLLIVLLAFLAFRGYRIKQKQHKMLEIQNHEIEIQALKLNESNAELQATLENLRSTQTQLIQSEKMASLGQLIAGIAHELNTPLGAIKSSIGTVKDASSKTVSLLPTLIKQLNENELSLFLEMIQQGTKNMIHLTSREERAIRKKLSDKFESINVERAEDIAETLTDIGVHEDTEKYFSIFKHQDLDLILQTAYYLAVQSKNAENIKTAVDRAAKIIFALKSYSHSGSSDDKIKANLIEGINTVLTIYHNQLKHGVTVEKSFEELPEVTCFPNELNQVWTNLIHNGLQAMNYKGTLSISAQKTDTHVVIGITDTGTGIPVEIREKIFNPFFTTKPAGEGTGLGLDIVTKIIDRHHGKIWFDTETGKGTTFYIEIPIE